MSESVILCEGFHDRAFWDGWLAHLKCNSDGFKPGSPGFPAADPWGDSVRGGQFAFRSTTGKFLRIVPCNGKKNVLKVARSRLIQRTTKAVSRVVINIDADTTASGVAATATGLRHQDVLYQMKQIDSNAATNSDDEIEMDGGATKVSLVRWEVGDKSAPALPDQQTLERLACAAIVAAYPDRALSVQNWLSGRTNPPKRDPKEHAWSYMAGWYAEQGCEAFYANLWKDDKISKELELRLTSSGALAIANKLAS